MPSDMDHGVRCGRPEWIAAVGPDGLSTSRGLDALQYASLAGSSTGHTAAAACRGYRNDHLLDDQGYLQRAERVPEHLISEGCTSENLVPAYNMALGREVKSVRRTNGTSGVRAKPVSFIRGGSDGNGLPRMVIQQDQFFIRRRPQQAVGADASDLVDTGGRHCLINKAVQRERDNCSVQLSKGANHLLAMERSTSGDRDRVTQGRHPISSAATFQLYGQPAAPLSTGGDGSTSFGQTHHQQQYSIRHRYEQCQSAVVQDRVKDGYYGEVIASGGGRAPGDEGRTLSRTAENINRSVASDTGVDAGHRHTSGSSHSYCPIHVHIERDTTAPTSNRNARPYDAQSSVGMGNTNNTSSLQMRGTYDGRYQRARGVLSADPSEMSVNRMFAPGHSGDGSRFHHYKEDRGIGGRSSMGIGSEGGGDYQATAPFTHIRRSLSETANSSLASSYGGIRNVSRRPPPQHRQRLQTNQRPGFRFNDDANDVTAFNDGASTINVNESSSRFAASATTTTTASLSPPGHRSRKGFVAPSDLAIKGERISSPNFAALTISSNRNSTASGLGSPHANHVGLEMIDNHPSCRLQNFHMMQSISGDGFPTTPRSSGSTSTSSLTSPSRSASLLSTGDGGLLDQRVDPEKMYRARCPAPDCPGRGDCVLGATADTVAYEVTFKRGKMTFLLGDGLGDEGISCGDRVKVEADRGEDLGTVHRSLLLSEYLDALYEEKKAKAAKIAQNGGGGGADGGGSEGKKKRNKAKKHNLAEDGDKHSTSKQHHHHQQQKKQQQHEEVRDETCPVRTIKRILRPATEEELRQLEQKAQEEEQILHVCQTKVRNRGLPMKIVDAEYQFDRHKLTLFFEAERRVDFRELVRDLFAVYKTRIWMQQVKDKDKKSTLSLSGNTTPDSDAPASAIGSCGNNNSDASGLGNPFLNVPSSLLIDDAVTAHDADHDSGYGSAVSSDSGHPMVECLVSLAEGGDGSDTGGAGGSGSSALGFDSISDAFCGHNDSFKKSGSTPCAPSMSWLDEIESNESVGGSGGISFRSKRPFAAQYPVLLQGIDFSF